MTVKTRTTLFPSWDACIPHTDIWLQAGGIGRVRRCKRGEVLYSQHQPHRYFYLLRSGFVRADMGRENGRRLTLEVMGPGSLFGEGAAFDGGLRYVDAWCVTDVVLSIYEPAEVSRAPQGIALFESLVKIMSAKQRVLAAKLLHFAESNPELRLRQLLARSANGPVKRRGQGNAVPSGNGDLLLRAGGGGDCNFNQEKDQQTE